MVLTLLALVLAGALAAVIVLSSRGVAGQEGIAHDRAVAVANDEIASRLTPKLLSKAIVGQDYRDLILQVQSHILATGEVARVRIWNADATLVFSSDQRDKVGQFRAPNDPRIGQALDGRALSIATDSVVAAKAGLAGSTEKLYETFVPLRVAGETTVTGVAEIDRRYSSIEDAATRAWRPFEWGVGAVLAAVVVLLLASFSTGSRAASRNAGAVAGFGSGAADGEHGRRMRAAEERATSAEQRATSAEQRATSAEQRATAAERHATSIEERTSIAERSAKDLQARAEKAERDLQQMTLARRSLEEETAEARRRVEEIERELAAVRSEHADADGGRTEAETEIARLAEQVDELQEARARLVAEADDLRARLERRDGELEEARSHVASAPDVDDELHRRVAELEAKVQAAVEGEVRSKAAEAVTRDELVRATTALTERDAEVERLWASAAEREAELERLRVAATEQDADLERLRASAAELDRADAEGLQQRLEEVEARRRAEAEELHRLQAALGNTQVELLDATKRAKAAEARVEELERERETAAVTVSASSGATPESTLHVVERADEDEDEERGTFASRLARLRNRREREAPIQPSDEPLFPVRDEPGGEPEGLGPLSLGPLEEEPTGEPPQLPPIDEETVEASGTPQLGEAALSLRERLARAAAARHRVAGGGPEDGES